MREFTRIVLVLVLATSWSPALDARQPKVDEVLQKELAQMVKDDQEARFAMIELMKKSDLKDPETAKKFPHLPEVMKVGELDVKHTQRMKEMTAKHGWPGKSLVGVKGSHDAWLLVQHADRDLAFQKQCLRLMEEAVKKDEADKKDFAYLTDRVLCAENKKQLYGTQLHTVNDELTPRPIEDEAKVDERRKAVGLQPLAEYLKFAREGYQKKGK